MPDTGRYRRVLLKISGEALMGGRDYGLDHWPFRQLQYQDSRSDILLQINDLLLGAVGFLRNGMHKVEPTKHSPKTELALHIQRASPVRSFWQDTSDRQGDFTLWALRFDGKKGKEAFRNRAKFKTKNNPKHRKGSRKPKLP